MMGAADLEGQWLETSTVQVTALPVLARATPPLAGNYRLVTLEFNGWLSLAGLVQYISQCCRLTCSVQKLSPTRGEQILYPAPHCNILLAEVKK
jgi:hypothetical protein